MIIAERKLFEQIWDSVKDRKRVLVLGCGICASVCPRKAITLQHYSDEQVLAKTAVLVE